MSVSFAVITLNRSTNHLRVQEPGVERPLRLLKLGDKGVAEAPRLEAWTSAICADAHRSGSLTVHRWDLLLGPSARSGRGAHPLHTPVLSPWSQSRSLQLIIPYLLLSRRTMSPAR